MLCFMRSDAPVKSVSGHAAYESTKTYQGDIISERHVSPALIEMVFVYERVFRFIRVCIYMKRRDFIKM